MLHEGILNPLQGRNILGFFDPVFFWGFFGGEGGFFFDAEAAERFPPWAAASPHGGAAGQAGTRRAPPTAWKIPGGGAEPSLAGPLRHR